MSVSKSMQNQEGGQVLCKIIETISSYQMWINGWLDHHQTKKSVGQNQEFLDVKTKCNG